MGSQHAAVYLSSLTAGHDNNFNLIRIAAALAVLVTHSFALVTGSPDAEPLRQTLGITMGGVAVDVFFITSGFLVTTSLFRRGSALEFIWARILRVYPALLIMLVLSVFVLGVYFTSLPAASYLRTPHTYGYLIRCATLILGADYTLPGVFEANPNSAVNGSLWTMPNEVRCYAALSLAWIALRPVSQLREEILKRTIVTATILLGTALLSIHIWGLKEIDSLRLFFMFSLGSTIYLSQRRITLSGLGTFALALALLSACTNRSIFFIVYLVAIAPLLLYLAYVPGGILRSYNRLGDYSYGVYIYAFPVQQSIITLIPGISVLQLILLSIIVTLILAWLSWHFVERNALRRRHSCVQVTRNVLSRRGSLPE